MAALRSLSLELAAIVIASSVSSAATIVVDWKGGADFTEIWAAMEAAADGDTVLVKPGEYWINAPVDFRGKAVQLKSQAGPQRTTIRMHPEPSHPHWGSVVAFMSAEGPGSVLDGFTIQGGSGIVFSWCGSCSDRTGGGIYCGEESSPTIRNCTIRGNAAPLGGGICCHEGSCPTVTDCTISGNLLGGGVLSMGRRAGASPALQNCRITENFGGGVLCVGSSASLEHCTVAWNYGGPGVSAADKDLGGEFIPSSVVIRSSILGDNVGEALLVGAVSTADVSFSCVAGAAVWPGAGNIVADPLFCGWQGAGEVHVDASHQGPGDGSQGNPYPDLESALGAYSYALLSSSPCLGSGEGGSNMGAGLGTCDQGGGASRIVHLAPGTYDICGLSLVQHASLLGAGAGKTVVEGAVFGLRDGSALQDLTVTGGNPFGVAAVSANALEIARCEVSQNKGAGIYLQGASPRITGCSLTKNLPSWWWFGGGLVCMDGSSPEVTGCIIAENEGMTPYDTRNCTGACCDKGSSPSFTGCLFERNVADGIVIGQDSSTTLRGCRIRQQLGAGVSTTGNASARLIDCVLSDNSVSGFVSRGESSASFDDCEISGNGLGGLRCEANTSVTLDRSRIVGNSVGDRSGGGALFFGEKTRGVLNACSILGNQAGMYGAAVFILEASVTLVNCEIVGNKQNPSDLAPEDAPGGVIFCRARASLNLIHCTIAGNHLQRGGAVVCEESLPSAILESCIIWGNVPEDPTCGTLTGCLTNADPLFVRPGVFDFERFRPLTIGGKPVSRGNPPQPVLVPDFIVEEPDCYLRSGSPAIDAATVDPEAPTDIAGTPRPCGAGADIGAHEVCDAAGKARFRRGDSNADGKLNIADAIALVSHLFRSKALPCLGAADADGNNALELTDAARLLGFLFIDSEPPEAPFRQCGPDLDAGALTCERYEPCE